MMKLKDNYKKIQWGEKIMAILIKIMLVLLGLIVVFAIGYTVNNLFNFNWYKNKTKRAGFEIYMQ